MLGRKSALWFASAITVLAIAVPAADGATRERPCNGAVELCGRTLDQVVLPGAHNAMSNEEYDWNIPNQHYSIPTQLDMGVRAFLIDTHYGKVSDDGKTVVKVPEAEGHSTGATMYLCHEYCQLGASELIPELAKIKDFLAANPREVLVFVNEDYIDPQDFASAVTQSGLIDYIYTGSTDHYPTLSEMIASNQRVVMLAESDSGTVPWYHKAYDGSMQETRYDYRYGGVTTQQAMTRLTDPAQLDASCAPNRGGTTGPLFLMNHWVNGKFDNGDPVTPDPAVADVLNTKDVLVARARACEQVRGKLPNIVAVDDFGNGDLLGAVNELNGVTPKAFFEVAKPRGAVVRAGRKAIFRVKVSNYGNVDAATKVCATLPARLAFRSRCATLSVARGGGATAKITVSTRRRARGLGVARFKVSGSGDTVSATAKLRVKPMPKKKPKRRPARHKKH
ncbi:MAG: hypothetical protein J0H98_00475 [Solirubrobacterales bacterium]|nr:hypothetical protein [Solirubrobacterales bacterium]